jgi:ferrochelatase
VRAFLAGLLGDPRVVEIPRLLWWPILHGIILRVRPRASAKKVCRDLDAAGLPLAVESEGLRRGSEERCGPRHSGGAGHAVHRRRQRGQAIDGLRARGVDAIIVVPDVSRSTAARPPGRSSTR